MDRIRAKYNSFFGDLNLVITLLIVLLLPLYINIGMRILLVLMVVVYVIEIILDHRFVSFSIKDKRYSFFFISILFYFFLQYLYLPFEQNTSFFLKVSEERLSFLIIGIIGLIGLNSKYKLKTFAWAYIASSLIYCFFLLSHLNSNILFSNELFTYLGEVREKTLNSHMKFNFHLNVTLIFIYYLLQTIRHQKVKLEMVLLYCSAFVILSILLISNGRVGVLTSLLLLVMMIFHFLWEKSKIFTSIFLLIIAIVFSTFIIHNSRFSTEILKNEPRFKIWQVSLLELKDSKFVGEGASTAWYNLNKDLSVLNVNYKHAHNVLIQTTIEYGIIGFLTILAIFFSAYYAVSKRYRFLMKLILLAAFFQLMFGSFMRDVEPLAFLLPLLLIIHQDTIEIHSEKGLTVSN